MDDRAVEPRRASLAPHAPRASLHLLPIAASIPRARHTVDQALPAGCGVDELTLLVSELAANAVRHARTPFTVSMGCDGTVVRVEVADTNPVLPVLRMPAIDAVTGRGLMIVDAIATAWGVEPTMGGKVVWFEVTCGSNAGD